MREKFESCFWWFKFLTRIPLWLGSIKLSSVESPNFFLVTISLSEISVIRIQIAEFTILQNSIQDLNVRVFELAITITLRT